MNQTDYRQNAANKTEVGQLKIKLSNGPKQNAI